MGKLLALDQSSRTSGYAIFENAKLIDYGTFTMSDNDIGERLVKIRNKIKKIIEDNQIDEVVLEDIQLQGNVTNNVQTFKTLAEVFGVLYELVTEMGIKNSAVLSSSWKSTLKVKGRTRPEQKKSAQQLIENTFNIKASQDACDAICIGLHHLIKPAKEMIPFDWSD